MLDDLLDKIITKIKQSKRTLLEFGIISALGLVSQTWFASGKLINGVDTLLPLNLPTFIDEYLYIWSNKSGLGITDINKLPFLLPIGFLLKIYSLLGLPFSPLAYEKILVYFLFTGAGVSSYILFKTLFKNSTTLGRISAVIFYMFNFYVMFLFSPLPLNLLFGYCFFPLVFSQLTSFIHKLSISTMLVFVLTWVFFLNPAYATPPYLLIHVGIFGLYLIYYLFFCSHSQILKTIGYFCLAIVLWTAINSYWLLPLSRNLQYELKAYDLGQPENQVSLFKMNSVSIYEGWRLMGYFGFNSDFLGSRFYPWYEIYKTQPYILLSYFLPILAFLGGIFKRHRQQYVFLFGLTLLFIFLVKGPYGPFGGVNIYIYQKLGLYTLFRTGYQRFMGFVALGLTMMAAYSIDQLYQIQFFPKKFRLVFLLALIIIIPAVFCYPLWHKKIYTHEGVLPSPLIKIPNSYYQAATWLDQESDLFNVLPIPYNEIGLALLWWNDGNDGYAGVYPLSQMTNQRFVFSALASSIPKQLVDSLLQKDVDALKLLGLFNVKYLVLHEDSNWRFVEAHPLWSGGTRAVVEESLANQTQLHLVKDFGGMKFYQNNYFLPRFYIPDQAIIADTLEHPEDFLTLRKNTSAQRPGFYFRDQNIQHSDQLPSGQINGPEIEFKKINSTKYQINVHGAAEPFPLIFSETYDPGWQIFTSKKGQTESVITTLQRFNQKALASPHLIVNRFAHSWVINPDEVCSETDSCTKNPQGGYDFDLIVELSLQKFLYLGEAISLIAFLGVVTVLIYSKKVKNRKPTDQN